jgi:hypothetical protein
MAPRRRRHVRASARTLSRDEDCADPLHGRALGRRSIAVEDVLQVGQTSILGEQQHPAAGRLALARLDAPFSGQQRAREW